MSETIIGCPFCNLKEDIEIACETENCVAFYDGFPVSPGHTLIIPLSFLIMKFKKCRLC